MFIGTSISLILGQGVMMNIYYSRRAGLFVGAFFKRTYLPMLLPVVFLASLGWTLSYFWQVDCWTDLFIAIGAYGSLLVLTLFTFYLNTEEKDMFLVPLKKLLHIT